MNRLILIGNGFDLAHGLKTIYADLLIGIGKNGENDCVEAKKELEADHFASDILLDKKKEQTIVREIAGKL